MAASFAAVSQQVSKWHKHALERHQELLEPHMAWMGETERAIPTNNVVPKLAGPEHSITASLVTVFGCARRNLCVFPMVFVGRRLTVKLTQLVLQMA